MPEKGRETQGKYPPGVYEGEEKQGKRGRKKRKKQDGIEEKRNRGTVSPSFLFSLFPFFADFA